MVKKTYLFTALFPGGTLKLVSKCFFVCFFNKHFLAFVILNCLFKLSFVFFIQHGGFNVSTSIFTSPFFLQHCAQSARLRP